MTSYQVTVTGTRTSYRRASASKQHATGVDRLVEGYKSLKETYKVDAGSVLEAEDKGKEQLELEYVDGMRALWLQTYAKMTYMIPIENEVS